MAKLEKMKQIHADFSDKADIVIVYIEEAHPNERQHFQGNYEIDTHKSMDDRLFAAQVLDDQMQEMGFDCPVVVDRMDDAANRAYGALPERAYIVQNGKVVYVGGIGPMHFDLDEVEMCLAKLVK